MNKTPVFANNLEYATEHVYELQLTNRFLDQLGEQSDMFAYAQNDPLPPTASGALVPANSWYANYVTPLLTNSPQWAPVNALDATIPALELASLIAGSTQVCSEIMYLETNLNNLKENLFVGKDISTYNPVKANLGKVAEMAVVVQYLQDAKVAKAFRDVSNRVRDFYEDIDTVCAQANGQGPCAVPVEGQTYLMKMRDFNLDAAKTVLKAGKMGIAVTKKFTDLINNGLAQGGNLDDDQGVGL